MQRPINSTFTVTWNARKVFLQVVAQTSCDGCFFNDANAGMCNRLGKEAILATTGICLGTTRPDKTSIIFKQVTNNNEI